MTLESCISTHHRQSFSRPDGLLEAPLSTVVQLRQELQAHRQLLSMLELAKQRGPGLKARSTDDKAWFHANEQTSSRLCTPGGSLPANALGAAFADRSVHAGHSASGGLEQVQFASRLAFTAPAAVPCGGARAARQPAAGHSRPGQPHASVAPAATAGAPTEPKSHAAAVVVAAAAAAAAAFSKPTTDRRPPWRGTLSRSQPERTTSRHTAASRCGLTPASQAGQRQRHNTQFDAKRIQDTKPNAGKEAAITEPGGGGDDDRVPERDIGAGEVARVLGELAATAAMSVLAQASPGTSGLKGNRRRPPAATTQSRGRPARRTGTGTDASVPAAHGEPRPGGGAAPPSCTTHGTDAPATASPQGLPGARTGTAVLRHVGADERELRAARVGQRRVGSGDCAPGGTGNNVVVGPPSTACLPAPGRRLGATDTPEAVQADAAANRALAADGPALSWRRGSAGPGGCSDTHRDHASPSMTNDGATSTRAHGSRGARGADGKPVDGGSGASLAVNSSLDGAGGEGGLATAFPAVDRVMRRRSRLVALLSARGCSAAAAPPTAVAAEAACAAAAPPCISVPAPGQHACGTPALDMQKPSPQEPSLRSPAAAIVPAQGSAAGVLEAEEHRNSSGRRGSAGAGVPGQTGTWGPARVQPGSQAASREALPSADGGAVLDAYAAMRAWRARRAAAAATICRAVRCYLDARAAAEDRRVACAVAKLAAAARRRVLARWRHVALVRLRLRSRHARLAALSSAAAELAAALHAATVEMELSRIDPRLTAQLARICYSPTDSDVWDVHFGSADSAAQKGLQLDGPRAAKAHAGSLGGAQGGIADAAEEAEPPYGLVGSDCWGNVVASSYRRYCRNASAEGGRYGLAVAHRQWWLMRAAWCGLLLAAVAPLP